MDDGTQQELRPWRPEEAWQALAYRLMPSGPARVTPEQPPAKILPARLPPDLPVEIPMPEGSRIVGSVLNKSGLERAMIYGDASQSPPDVLAFYRERLVSHGWYELDIEGQRPGGFNAADPSYQVRGQFCRGERGPAIFVEATRQERAPTALRITVYTDERTSPCLPRERRGPPSNPIPPLPPPSDAHFVMGAGPVTSARMHSPRPISGLGPAARHLTGSLGPYSAHSSIEIETDLDLNDLAIHYNRHLEAGGWAKGETGQSERTAWSRWTFQPERDERWQGLFMAFERPDLSHRYILHVLAESLREP